MYSSPRPGTPYIAFPPKPNDDYFDENGRQLSSPLQSSLRGSKNARPATPYTPSLSNEDVDSIIGTSTHSVRTDKYGLGLGIAPRGGSSPQARFASGEQSRSTSGNLSGRRPSLQIVRMPSVHLEDPSLPTGRTTSSTGSSDGESDATLTGLRSLSISSVRGPGQARFETEQDDGSDGDGTPRVDSFAAAMRNSQRRATPYPCDKDAYFDEEEEIDEEEQLEGTDASTGLDDGASIVHAGLRGV